MIPIAKPTISGREIKSVIDVLKSGHLVSGERVEEFEKKFARYINVKHAIATSNGTSALHTALLSLGIMPGDEIITTAFSFIASSNCILFVGAKPVFVDIDPKTYNIDPDEIKKNITNKTRAVLIVHLFGQPCEMEQLVDICKEKHLLLIEDACQAHGAEYDGKKVGSFGDVATFSFYATKNMTTGEGGMITTNNDEVAEKSKLIVNQGQSKKYYHTALGFNFRMTEIQAALGIFQLKKLDDVNKKRIKNAKFMTKSLLDTKELVTPFVSPKVRHVFHQYAIRSKQRDKLQTYLLNKGIQTAIHYPVPIYRQPIYQSLGFNINLKNTEMVSRDILSLPVHQSLSKRDLEKITTEVKKFHEK